MNATRSVRRLLRATSLLALVACGSIEVKTTPAPGAPHYAATDPGKVELLRSPPARNYDRLGDIQLDSSTDPAPPITDLGETLREEAAKLGADAVVILQYREVAAEAAKEGSAPAKTIHRALAVAIKYR